jgi:uncharacterized iron-regulated membrane protein
LCCYKSGSESALNQIVSLFTALGPILISISAVILSWRRRPEGILGAPIPLGRPRFTYGLAALIIALGMYLPLFRLSLFARHFDRTLHITKDFFSAAVAQSPSEI